MSAPATHVLRSIWRWGRRLAAAPLREPWRIVVRRLPRDRTLVLVGAAADRFGDNPAYFFLHADAASTGMRFVWVTGSRDVGRRLHAHRLPVVRRRSLRGLWLCLRAGWYVVGSYPSDVSRWCHDGALVLNLWHGVGPKAIERQLTTGPLALLHSRRRRDAWLRPAFADETRKPDLVLSTSPAATRRVFAPAFDLPEHRCLAYGYPRTDALVAGRTDVHPALVRDPSLLSAVRDSDRPVVGYFPTWRDDQSDFLARAGLDLEGLAATVADAGGRLLFKAHHNARLNPRRVTDVFLLDPSEDVNAYLPHCRCVVTDFSSVASDFLLLDRPLLFFTPDLDAFLASRRLAFTPDEVMPGPHLSTATELRAELVKALAPGYADPYVEARARARRLLWGDYTGGASEALLRHIDPDSIGATDVRPVVLVGAGGSR